MSHNELRSLSALCAGTALLIAVAVVLGGGAGNSSKLALTNSSSQAAATALGDSQSVPAPNGVPYIGHTYPADILCWVYPPSDPGYSPLNTPLCPTIGNTYWNQTGNTDIFATGIFSVDLGGGAGKSAYQTRTVTLGGQYWQYDGTGCPSGDTVQNTAYFSYLDVNSGNTIPLYAYECYTSSGQYDPNALGDPVSQPYVDQWGGAATAYSGRTAQCPAGSTMYDSDPAGGTRGTGCYESVTKSSTVSDPSGSIYTGSNVAVSPGTSMTLEWSCLPSRLVGYEYHVPGGKSTILNPRGSSSYWATSSSTLYLFYLSTSSTGSDTAGDGWSPSGLTGTQSVTAPTIPGTYNYSLTCNSGTNAMTIPVTVIAPPTVTLTATNFTVAHHTITITVGQTPNFTAAFTKSASDTYTTNGILDYQSNSLISGSGASLSYSGWTAITPVGGPFRFYARVGSNSFPVPSSCTPTTTGCDYVDVTVQCPSGQNWNGSSCIAPVCTPNWSCATWDTTCTNGTQTCLQYSDSQSCGVSYTGTPLTQSCSVANPPACDITGSYSMNPGGSVNLIYTSSDATSLTFTNTKTGATINAVPPAAPTVSPANTTTYSATARGADGSTIACTGLASVTVNPSPIPTITWKVNNVAVNNQALSPSIAPNGSATIVATYVPGSGDTLTAKTIQNYLHAALSPAPICTAVSPYTCTYTFIPSAPNAGARFFGYVTTTQYPTAPTSWYVDIPVACPNGQSWNGTACTATPTVTIAATDAVATINTSPADTGTFTVSRTSGTSALTVNYSLSGTGALGTHYSVAAGTCTTLTASTFVIPTNFASCTIILTPTNGSFTSGTKTAIYTPAAGTGYTAGSGGTVTIRLPTVNITANAPTSITEAGSPNSTTYTFARTTTYSVALPVTFNTTGGTAAVGTDYTLSGGTCASITATSATIPANSASCTVKITAAANSIPSGSSKTARLVPVTAPGYIAGVRGTVTINGPAVVDICNDIPGTQTAATIPPGCQLPDASNNCVPSGYTYDPLTNTCVAIAAPTGSITQGLLANPTRVQRTHTTTLSWATIGMSSCSIDNGVPPIPTTGNISSPAINAATTFTLSCTDNAGDSFTSTATVGILPVYQEI